MEDVSDKTVIKAFSGVSHQQNVIDAELRFSAEEDIDSVLDFYRGNRHQHVHIRDEALLIELVRAGDFLVLKDKSSGEILASSGTYAYHVSGDKEQPSFKEIGSTRFSEKLAGFGLYPLFISSQVVHSMLTDPCKHMFIANVYDDSPVGRELLTKKAGWKIIDATPDILDVFKATKDQEASKDKVQKPMTWYGSPPSCLPHQAGVVLDFIANKTSIQHKRRDAVLNIDYSRFELAHKYADQLAVLKEYDPEQMKLRDKFNMIALHISVHKKAGLGVDDRPTKPHSNSGSKKNKLR
jgi:hypothetical protein